MTIRAGQKLTKHAYGIATLIQPLLFTADICT